MISKEDARRQRTKERDVQSRLLPCKADRKGRLRYFRRKWNAVQMSRTRVGSLKNCRRYSAISAATTSVSLTPSVRKLEIRVRSPAAHRTLSSSVLPGFKVPSCTRIMLSMSHPGSQYASNVSARLICGGEEERTTDVPASAIFRMCCPMQLGSSQLVPAISTGQRGSPGSIVLL
jgi:hypothetical protein